MNGHEISVAEAQAAVNRHALPPAPIPIPPAQGAQLCLGEFQYNPRTSTYACPGCGRHVPTGHMTLDTRQLFQTLVSAIGHFKPS